MLLNLYKSLICPYGNTVWGPQFVLDRRAIEHLQRHATKLITVFCNNGYMEHLHSLNLPSLYYRRTRGDII